MTTMTTRFYSGSPYFELHYYQIFDYQKAAFRVFTYWLCFYLFYAIAKIIDKFILVERFNNLNNALQSTSKNAPYDMIYFWKVFFKS